MSDAFGGAEQYVSLHTLHILLVVHKEEWAQVCVHSCILLIIVLIQYHA